MWFWALTAVSSKNNCTDFLREHEAAPPILQNGAELIPSCPGEALRMARSRQRRWAETSTRSRRAADQTSSLVDFDALNLIISRRASPIWVYAAHGCNVVVNMARGTVILPESVSSSPLISEQREVQDYALCLLFQK